jgi:hypothetical protein
MVNGLQRPDLQDRLSQASDHHAQSLRLRFSHALESVTTGADHSRRIAESNRLALELRTSSLYIGSVVNDSRAGPAVGALSRSRQPPAQGLISPSGE